MAEELTEKQLKHWKQEKELIPVMIKMYCHGNHGTKGSNICDDCADLTEYAEMRLEKCPFKKDKKFCSFCKIHCYKPDYQAKIKAVMKYSGPRMLTSHPVFAVSHVVQMIKYKKQQKKSAET